MATLLHYLENAGQMQEWKSRHHLHGHREKNRGTASHLNRSAATEHLPMLVATVSRWMWMLEHGYRLNRTDAAD